MKKSSGLVSLVGFATILNICFSNCSKVAVTDVGSNPSLKSSGVVEDNPAGEQIIPDLSHKDIVTSTDLRNAGDKLDIALIIDNSGSMKDDSAALAGRLGEFVTKLSQSGIDWQMCFTNTDIKDKGLPFNWNFSSSSTMAADKRIVNSMTNNFARVFTDTVNGIDFSKGSGDERGIATLRMLVENRAQHGCLRAGAALTSIIISDEDERSAGGNMKLGQYQPIEDIDKPEMLLLSVANKGNIARFVANSIIVPSTDAACIAKQDQNGGKIGTFYERLSNFTTGGIGSICDSNYAPHLNLFFDKIADNFQKVQLICAPVEGSVQVKVNQAANSYSYKIEGGALSFNLLTSAVYHVDIKYTCK